MIYLLKTSSGVRRYDQMLADDNGITLLASAAFDGYGGRRLTLDDAVERMKAGTLKTVAGEAESIIPENSEVPA